MIPKAIWRHDGLADRCLILEDTEPGDDVIAVRVNPAGFGIYLDPDAADEIAANLQARAELVRRTRPGAVL